MHTVPKFGTLVFQFSLQLSVTETRCRAAVGDKERLEEQLTESEREKRGSEKKVSQLQTKLNKASSELNEEKEVQKSLWLSRYLLSQESVLTYFCRLHTYMFEFPVVCIGTTCTLIYNIM